MSAEERIQIAIELARQARTRIDEASSEPDPVKERIHLVEAAKRFRKAADYLDDEGRLAE